MINKYFKVNKDGYLQATPVEIIQKLKQIAKDVVSLKFTDISIISVGKTIIFKYKEFDKNFKFYEVLIDYPEIYFNENLIKWFDELRCEEIIKDIDNFLEQNAKDLND